MPPGQGGDTKYMYVIFNRLFGHFGRSLEKRANIHIESNISKSGTYNFGTPVMSILTHFCNHDPWLTACTGIDAMVHAIEAFVSSGHSPITDTHALEAVQLISSSLLDSLSDPTNVEIRGKVMLGSLQAGLAFSNASLGGVHAMAHSLGGLLDLPHGECNAMLFDHVIAFNFPEAADRYGRIGEALGLELRKMTSKEARAAVLDEIRRLRGAVGLRETLGAKGVHRTEIPELSCNAMEDPCMLTNPRVPVHRDIEVIYEESL